MANKLPKDVLAYIQKIVYQKADKHGYALQGRPENGRFMDDLVEDPEIGGVIKKYVAQENVRTYIKDGILNAYTKQKCRQKLNSHDPVQIICRIYDEKEAYIVNDLDDVVVCTAHSESFFVLGRGTVLKWESALRKVLEYISRTPGIRGKSYPCICLQLAVINDKITEGDKTHIVKALETVGVKVFFCS